MPLLSRRRFLPACFVLIGLLGFSAAARAQDDAVKRGPSHELVPYRYDAAVWKTVPRDFLDDYSACILYYGTNHLIDADGTVETIVHEITRLNGRKGIDSLGEYRNITYDPSYQTLVLNEARILKADGKIVPIEARHIQVRDTSTDFQTYERNKQVVISFPNLEVGDCYEVKFTTRGKGPEFGDRFFTRVTFGDDQYPTVRDELRVRLPESMPLHHATVNGKVEQKISVDKGQRSGHWYVDNRRPPPKDVDRPSKETLQTQLVLSTFASWDEVGRWKDKVRAECWTCTPEIRELVTKLTRDSKTPLDKARALTYWVRRAIRYVSVSSSGKGYTPRLPQQVVSSRYGDCKDQAQLLAVMLKEAGLDVSLVTLGLLDDGQVIREVPSPWGTHGILLVKIDKKEHWIDTTATLAGWDLLPRGDRDRVVYVTQGAKLRLLRTPALAYADNRIVQYTDLTVQPDGTTVGRRAMSYFGLAAVGRRDAWMEVPPGERRRAVTADLQDAHSRSRLVRFDIDDKELAKLDEPVQARMEYQITNHFSGDLSVREGSVSDSYVWNRVLAYNLDPDRGTPLSLWSPFESVHRYSVQLPLAYRFDGLPRDQKVRSKWGEFELRVKSDDKDPRRLEITFNTRLENVLVKKPDFAAFQKFHDEVSKHWRVWLTLKPTLELADAPALEALLASTKWADLPSATILAKLYQHHRKLTDARRVVLEARAKHPADATLLDLSVQCAASPAEEEDAYAELVRLFPDEPKHALALAAVRIKRGDQDGARKVLTPLTEKGSDETRALAHYHLARIALADGDAKGALDHLDAAKNASADTVATPAVQRFKAELHE